MGEARDPTIERTDGAEPVDVIDGPVGSAKLKEPSEVEGSVPPVRRDDLDAEVGADPLATGGDRDSGRHTA